MKRIFISILTLALVSFAVYGATRAQFMDTETSEGNTFAAGQIDLEMGASTSMPFAVSNIMMGDSGEGNITLTSAVGNADGNLTVAITDFVQAENGCIDPEIDAGDPCGAGDLDLGFKMAMFLDVNQDGTYTQADGDIELEYSGNTNTTAGLQYAPASSFVGDSWTPFPMVSGQSVDLVIEWQLPLPFNYPKHENIMQTDSLGFDVVTTLEQL
ncbi:MAG: CalY family protein [Candidatus Roizmanbacteria bacterium]|nr:CalY family protein [Candidatus Roizmanbacteria bacterium]